MKLLNLNIPIVKVDEEQRIVYGIATKEELDRQGDIVDYEASKKAFTAWGGNIREQHDAKRVIGKKTLMEFDDDNKQILIGAYVSKSPDGENAWTKVKEGLFTGFSIGGKIKSIVKETMNKDDGSEVEANRIMDYDLSELSLVDVPACPSAQLVMVKSASGRVEEVEELHQTNDGSTLPWFMKSFTYSVNQLQKSGDTKDMGTQSKESAMADAKLEKVNVHAGEERDVNADVVETKDEAVEKAVAVHAGDARDAEAKDVTPEIGGKDENEAADHVAEQKDEAKADVAVEAEKPAKEVKAEATEEAKTEEKADQAEMKKGLYAVSQLGDLIQNLCWIAEDAEWEAQYEGDGSTVPGQLKDAVKNLVAIYKQMAQEEADEAASGDDETVELADRPTDMIKMVDKKFADYQSEMAKAVGDVVAGKVAEQLKPLEDRIKTLESQPVGGAPVRAYAVVEKVADQPNEADELSKAVADMEAHPENYSISDRTALAQRILKARHA